MAGAGYYDQAGVAPLDGAERAIRPLRHAAGDRGCAPWACGGVERGTGLYAASGGSPLLTHHHHERLGKFGVMRCSPVGIVASIVGTLNFNLVAAFRIRGASCGFSSACASSAHALGFAFDEISLGRQDRMFVVGGEDGNYDAILPFAGMRTLSLQSDPNVASRPFDVARDGFVGTGGGVVLVAESEREVERRACGRTAKSLDGVRRPMATMWPSRIRRAPACRRPWRWPFGRAGSPPPTSTT